MTEADSDQTLAHGIVARSGRAPEAIRMLGQGANNVIFLAECASGNVAVKLCKPHRADVALGEYRKEAWCAAQARACGVRTPLVLEFGVFGTRPFAILEFADGSAPAAAQACEIWRHLGDDARRIHDIAVSGWGVTLSGDGVFGDNWRAHLDYNIASLGESDALRAMEVLDAAASQRLLRAFERLRQSDFRIALCHGDIALSNALVGGDAKPWLLDWGSAFAHVVPHYEINEILRGPAPPREQLAAFLDGYGLSQGAYAAMTPDLLALAALREVDTLRWAIDRKPELIAEMRMRAKTAIAKLA